MNAATTATREDIIAAASSDFTPIGTFAHKIDEAERRDILNWYVVMYDGEASGDSIKQYATQASFDVYPVKFGSTTDRLQFRTELKERLRVREMRRATV